MIKPGHDALEPDEIKSKSISLNDELDDPLACIKKRFSDNGFVVAYMDYKVLIGKYVNHRFIFAENDTIDADRLKYLQRLRIFDAEKEILIWRTEDGKGDKRSFDGRLRIDGEGKINPIADACQVLWGTLAELPDNGFIRIREDRGTELILPFSNLQGVDDKKNRVFLKTRNYIAYNQVHQATYIDSRFMGFIFKGNDLELEVK
jgi:CRISPR-associated protein (TIGR03984 family)